MVATSHPIATQIAIEILKKGGSAVDAAIAANAFYWFCRPRNEWNRRRPVCNRLGCKNKKIIWIKRQWKVAKNMSLAYLQAKEKEGISYVRGPLSVTVPGCVDGWFELHNKFGKLPIPEILQPAINYAIEGVPITQETADNMADG